eukprot:CAMPEP_0174361976 /NCGR_PEP_ID=MMETSP0811_2-20130205/61998_1 /TAXON_ID=73025 ORGANISM="Eutreptiella gymnastica-like, Strain CCMP1594" /NCGR_SAMPLE_ID=MMETSP0811_2 /ASSEMBLY_ACC=CAM_ASM_000667 /LENGTH=119 /DNA_ID=CAMNT_0015499151 /DNA_START=1 /DNA_END=356 /DNA_ORIENTATION=+
MPPVLCGRVTMTLVVVWPKTEMSKGGPPVTCFLNHGLPRPAQVGCFGVWYRCQYHPEDQGKRDESNQEGRGWQSVEATQLREQKKVASMYSSASSTVFVHVDKNAGGTSSAISVRVPPV